MEMFMSVLGEINNIVWGPGMLILLVGTGLYLTIGLRLFSFRKIPHGFANLWKGRKSSGHGEISPFNALMTALAATIGTGNIVGVATAIFIGGPGALFWMWMTALAGMATKFSEILLAVHYREKTPQGNFVGGAMYFIKNGLGEKWKWLGTAFALLTVVACFGIGNLVQCNAISEAMLNTFSIPNWVTGIILFGVMSGVLLGGLKRIGEVAGMVVPIMAAVYIVLALIVLIVYADQIPRVFMWVIMDAFTPTAATGGFAGATVMMAVRMGMARGIFSNEAGLGSAPIAHATAATDDPMNQATLGMLDVFIDTLIVCSMTGFAILVTGMWNNELGYKGAAITINAFEAAMPGIGGLLVSICLLFFAFTTALGWCVYGERCAIYLFGDKALKPFRFLYTIVIPIGCITQLEVVWLLADTFNALMAIPNLVGLLLLSPVIFKLVREYEARGK